MEQENMNKKDIEYIKEELSSIKKILLAQKISEQSLKEEINEWEVLSDEALEDFEENLNE